eukprot:1026740-Amphidinium_carterae.3
MGLHAYVGSRGTINRISARPPNIRSRGRYTSRPRATTLQPHYEILHHELLHEAAQDVPYTDDPYTDYNNHGQEAANNQLFDDDKANLTRLLQYMRQAP